MRRLDFIGVQTTRNVAGRVAIHIVVEDAANDLRLIFDNLKFACTSGNRSIAVGLAARLPSLMTSSMPRRVTGIPVESPVSHAPQIPARNLRGHLAL